MIARNDLPTGILSAQLIHGAGESAGSVGPGTYAIALSATAEELQALEDRLKTDGIPHAAIRENDPPYCGQLLAIGIKPGIRSTLRRYCSKFPLIK